MNASKTKGTAWETEIVRYLRDDAGVVHAERRALAGVADRGDVAGVPGLVVSAKNCAQMKLADWVREVEKQRTNARGAVGVVWHKRRGHARAGDGYVTMSGHTFVALLRAAGYIA